jgi:predicted RNA binding protein YcfA (HicA-like mRNA interferase family)
LGRLRVPSGDEVCRILERNGFVAVRQRGSHRIMQKRIDNTTVTVPVPLHDPLKLGTLSSITRQSALARAYFEVDYSASPPTGVTNRAGDHHFFVRRCDSAYRIVSDDLLGRVVSDHGSGWRSGNLARSYGHRFRYGSPRGASCSVPLAGSSPWTSPVRCTAEDLAKAARLRR